MRRPPPSPVLCYNRAIPSFFEEGCMVDKVEKIWLDGALVDWDQANVHILTHSLHYGLGVFEGIRCYKLDDGRSAVFRLREHIRRLFDSARIVSLPMPFSQEEIVAACLETVRANALDACYLRPIAFVGEGAMGLGALHNPTRVSVIAWRWGAYLGDEGLQKGIRAKVSSFQRAGVNSLMAKGKVVGHYVNSILAKREVLAAGYDEAIMLDPQGYVCEASGENIFVVRDGVVHTPALGASILGGITRDSTIVLLKELGIPVVERLIARDELYVADEIFLVGTAAEVTPVRELDERAIGQGSRGPITERVQARYFEVVRGVKPPHDEWLAIV
jgi:branched-chain amino acid aminotransferase